eukprot:TRINITY_DN7316_c2_g1_i1.p1 TRINITY_DN7316_c2_g1~~TRINITY_DN7316_c2_g1_i1.p1  ORF type:complete len:519 (+),score=167.68 TRINITY_DN7316_c2_g1_i1:152-1558(+)
MAAFRTQVMMSDDAARRGGAGSRRGRRAGGRPKPFDGQADIRSLPQQQQPAQQQTIRVKDPAMKGNVFYNVPVTSIHVTAGLSEFIEAGSGKQAHKACICKLWVDERCGQGPKCKSFHVDRALVKAERASCGAELDDTFLTEVAVEAGGRVFAVGYNAVTRTRGLDHYREVHNRRRKAGSETPLQPINLCPHFGPGGDGSCPQEKQCQRLHLKPQEHKGLREGRHRTPCCMLHGDSAVHSLGRVCIEVTAGQRKFTLTSQRVACTSWLQKLDGGSAVASTSDLCQMHATSRCKFGRSCEKLHVCRDWAESTGMLAAINTARQSFTRPRPQALNTCSSGPMRAMPPTPTPSRKSCSGSDTSCSVPSSTPASSPARHQAAPPSPSVSWCTAVSQSSSDFSHARATLNVKALYSQPIEHSVPMSTQVQLAAAGGCLLMPGVSQPCMLPTCDSDFDDEGPPELIEDIDDTDG